VARGARKLTIETIIEALTEAIQLLFSLDPALLEIVGRSLHVTLTALAIATTAGVPFGVWLAMARFPGRRLLTTFVYTGMGFPPVVIGLIVYLFLSRRGPLGILGWLFAPKAMILAQVILSTPPIIGITMSSMLAVDPALMPQLRALGATRWQALRALAYEARFGIILAIVAGFGAVISEVGAVMMVGGNIEGYTRVLTTAIVLETRKGNFSLALALGAILLVLSFAANLVMMLGQGRAFRRNQ